MQGKNIEKRQEVLKVAFKRFSEADYTDVYLKDIAEDAGINKSLLQHYYPQKYSIMKELIDELMSTSFVFLDEQISEDTNIYIKLASYTMMLWNAADANRKLDRLLGNAFREEDIFDYLIESVYSWIKEMRYRSRAKFELPDLRIALFFSISGGMKLYSKRDKLNISVNSICKEIDSAFMRILGCSEAKIEANLTETERIAGDVDLDSFYSYCEEKIDWFDLI
ncbi:TetR/AcrR family transcriptional regulator [Caproiciproducens sp.]